jgi:alkylhydroperoxidase family enzyme
MAFIQIVDPAEATGPVRAVYEDQTRRGGRISQIVQVVSLRPKALALSHHFRCVTLFGASELGRRREEMIATLISDLLQCSY